MDRKRISRLSRLAKKMHDEQEQRTENMYLWIENRFLLIKDVCLQERRGIHRRITRDRDKISHHIEEISKDYRDLSRLKNNPIEHREILINLLNADREGIEFDNDRFRASFSFPVYNVMVSDYDMGDVYLGNYDVRMYYPSGDVFIIGGDYEKNDCNHPHVSGEVLCTGDNTAALNTCLERGDILSIKDIIDSTLRVYNPDSPHISLGDLISEEEECECCSEYVDNLYECYRCGHRVCDYCLNCCTSCCEDVCRDCSLQCDRCGEYFCDNDGDCGGMCSVCGAFICDCCRNECEICGRDICDNCSNEHEGDTICNECHEEIETETESDGENDNETESDVHTPGMGQSEAVKDAFEW